MAKLGAADKSKPSAQAWLRAGHDEWAVPAVIGRRLAIRKGLSSKHCPASVSDHLPSPRRRHWGLAAVERAA